MIELNAQKSHFVRFSDSWIWVQQLTITWINKFFETKKKTIVCPTGFVFICIVQIELQLHWKMFHKIFAETKDKKKTKEKIKRQDVGEGYTSLLKKKKAFSICETF